MEQIQIFDTINNKNVNIFVTKAIAEKCRLDANFAAELVRQIEEQNVEEGSTIEIETVAGLQSSSFDAFPLEKELWTRKETLKFLKLYQKYANKYANNKKALWNIVSKELAARNVLKPPDRCQSKWKNLIRTYKAAKERNNISRFQYYKAVDDVITGKQLVLSDSESDIDTCDENLILKNLAIEKTKSEGTVETWSRYETLQFLKIYQKCKNDIENKICAKEELWKIISNKLYVEGVYKSAEQCSMKYKNLLRTYKKHLEKDTHNQKQTFKYFKEVDDLMNGREITIFDELLSDTPEDSDWLDSGEFGGSVTNSNIEYVITEESDDDKMDKRPSGLLNWSQQEILKLYWAHNKHKNDFDSVENEQKFWELISQELQIVGFNRNSEECKNKWNFIQNGNSVRQESDDAGNSHIIIVERDSIDHSEREKYQISEEQDDFGCVKLIIENEENRIGNTDGSKSDNSWTDNNITNLISLCVKEIEKKKIKEINSQIWETISVNIGSTDTPKSAEECKQKWEDLLSTFETCKKLNLHCDNFSIFERIDEILHRSDEIGSQYISASDTTVCKCNERRLVEKQRRHTERMQILKRKLDIEERKVIAFEEYVKYVKR